MNNQTDSKTCASMCFLPFLRSDDQIQEENELLTYNPMLNEPKPFETNIGGQNIDNFQFISQNNNPNNDELKGGGHPPDLSYWPGQLCKK